MVDTMILGTDGTSELDRERLTALTEPRMIAGEADSAAVDWGEAIEGEESEQRGVEQASKQVRKRKA